MIYKICEKSPSHDLLNDFYSEFVKYSNTDSKRLGIVLTPHHIVQLMIKLLDVGEDDIFLDLCSGTGSFPLEALKYNPKKIIACEYQNKLYTLLKCNMILRDLDLVENDIIKGDCFDNKFKATKSAINPPYGMKDKKELDFILKQLESIDGLACAIIPCSKLTKSKIRNKLFSVCKILKIIICNNKLFYPTASVKTCIILIKKEEHKLKEQKIMCMNFENDGFVMKRGSGRVKKLEPSITEEEIIITPNDETWISYSIESHINKGELILRMLELEAVNKKLVLKNQKQQELEDTVYKDFLIQDLFAITKKTIKKI